MMLPHEGSDNVPNTPISDLETTIYSSVIFQGLQVSKSLLPPLFSLSTLTSIDFLTSFIPLKSWVENKINFGFMGDTSNYYDINNSYLDEVLRRRKGKYVNNI